MLVDNYSPQRSWCKVMFLHVSVIQGGGGLVVSQHALHVVSQHALQQVLGVWYPSMHCRFLGPHPRGKLRGLARGVACSRGVPAPGGAALGVPAPGGGVWRPLPL